MLDNQSIQNMLQNAKLNSITDIITFVIHHVSQETIRPFEILDERISELQRPKGMDRVMLQEVKTLIDAMLDQRQQQLKRELQRKCRDNGYNSFDLAENSRRSLNEIDYINIMNMQNGAQSQQLKKTTSNMMQTHINKNDLLMIEIRQLREQLQAKPQRKEVQDMKSILNSLSKDLVSKINFEQTEKLVLKFQKDIFLKISQIKSYSDELQSKMMKSMQNQMGLLKQDLTQAIKIKPLSKIQKKIKKYGQQICNIEDNIQDYNLKVTEYRNECNKYHKNSLDDIENMQGLIEQINQERQTMLLKESKAQNHTSFNTALWITAPPTYKNSYAVWEREIINNDKRNIQFQPGKTNIRLVNAGFYEISCAVYGGNGSMKKGPSIFCNSEQIGRLQMKSNNCQSLPRWYFKQLVYIKQNRSTLTLRFESQQNSSCILFWLNKFSY